MLLKKNIGASVMMVIVILPVLLYISLFINRTIVRYEMKERLEKVCLKTITLTKDSFTWVQKNEEIKTGGRLFDVKSYYALADKIVFIGLFDEDEDIIDEKVSLLTLKKKQLTFPIEKLSEIYLASVTWRGEYSFTRYNANDKCSYFFYDEVAVSQPRIFFVPPPNS